MNEQTFCFWLQGFVELTESDTISEKQWLVIKDHLKLVFDKKTPSRSESPDRKEYVQPSYDQILDALRPKPVDLIGKQFSPTFWIINPPYTISKTGLPVITC